MNLEEAKTIQKTYQIIRYLVIAVLLVLLGVATAKAETLSVDTLKNQAQEIEALKARLAALETKQTKHLKMDSLRKYMPQLHGILRGKYEYQTEPGESRFEVRNARLSVTGNLPLRSEYKLEVDLCDETKIKMKDAWVRINPWKSLRISLGQQRLPFSIDAHRNPAAQYFANRSFIAKQVGDMRDVGGMIGYTFNLAKVEAGQKAPQLILDGGIFNGATIDDQQGAWHKDWNYSARAQFLIPVGAKKDGMVALVPSVQHDAIATRQAHYTSLDFGAYYEQKGWHVEAEYLHKTYMKDAFQDCSSVDAMLIYKQNMKSGKAFIQSISYLGRYDWMGDHSSGKSGFAKDEHDNLTSTLARTDAERHRMTLGVTLGIRNPYFPTDIRFNYEKYWYPHDGANANELDKIVAEIAIKF